MSDFRVSRTAYVLGFAGLLPQAAALALVVLGRAAPASHVDIIGAGLALALVYGSLILSFLGGIWWGYAMQRGAAQAKLVVLGVLPSLAAVLVLGWAAAEMLFEDRPSGPLLVLGALLPLTLIVDYNLANAGKTPVGWMRLRVPLSVGLGGLTIAAGLLAR